MKTDGILAGYDAAKTGSAWTRRTDQAWIVVSGKDRASYLHGLLTNDIASLKTGEGVYSAYLTPQGRMISDLTAYELGDVMLLTLPEQTRQAVLAKLDQFIFSEDVQLGDVTDTFAAVSVLGPNAAAIVSPIVGLDEAALSAMPAPGAVRASIAGQSVIVLRVADRGVDAFDLLIDRSAIDARAAMLRNAGCAEVGSDVADALRIEAGIPRFPQDMDEEIIPLEAGIEQRAISFNKGCYVGQEVIIRVLHRGHGRVAKKLVKLALSGDVVPDAGTPIEGPEKAIGEVRSAAWSPALKQPIALGYVHRDFTEPGTRVRIGSSDAVVSPLPLA